MDFSEACIILDIESPFSLSDLKKCYYKAALRHHPDRNRDDKGGSEQFQKIGEAYALLGKYLEMEADELETEKDYDSVINRFMQSVIGLNVTEQSDTFRNVIAGCQKITLDMFKGLNKQSAIKMFTYIDQYSSFLGINEELLSSIGSIVREKMKDDTLIVLNPDVNKVFNQEVYVLEHNGTTFYVPLWHDEVCYDISGTSLIVRCIPDMPKHMSIDHNSDVHIHVSSSMCNVLGKETMNVNFGDKVFEIPVHDLKIRKHQIYTFKKQGIPRIDIDDAFNTERKGDVVVHLDLLTE